MFERAETSDNAVNFDKFYDFPTSPIIKLSIGEMYKKIQYCKVHFLMDKYISKAHSIL